MARVKISRLPNNRGLGWYSGNSINRDGDHGVAIDGRLSCYEGLVVPDGRLILPSIPTSDPGSPGRVWSNSGVLEISETLPSVTTHRAAWLYSDGATTDGLRLKDCRTGTGSSRTPQPGRCVNLNGTTQYVATTTATPSSKAHAVCEAWINVPAPSANYKTIFDQGTQQVQFSVQSWSTVLYVLVRNTGGQSLAATTTGIGEGWHHVVLRINRTVAAGSVIDLWVDGVKSTLSYAAATGTVITTFNTGVWTVGAVPFGPVSLFNSKISGARVILPSSAWSDAACAQLYTERTAPQHYADTHLWLKLDQPNSALQQDSSGNSNHGTIANWATGVHYSGGDVPYSWQNDAGFSADNGTNLIASPNDFSGWSTTEATYAANQEYEPSGNTLTADRFLETSATAVHVIQTSVSLGETTDGKTPYTLSVDIKPIGRATAQFILFDNSYSHQVQQIYTFASESVSYYAATGSFQNAGGSISNLGGGWYRIRIAGVPQSGLTSLRPVLYCQNASPYAGDTAKGFYVANAKLVKGSLHTPRKESDTTKDVLGNSLQHTGKCPLEAPFRASNCLTLNGSNQYVSVGTGTWDTDGTEAMEIECWLKYSTSGYQLIAANRYRGGSPYNGWELWASNNDGLVNFELCNTLTTNHLLVKCLTPINDGTWHKLKVTYDGSKTAAGCAFYVDGIRCAQSTVINTLTGSTAAASYSSVIGASSAGAYPLAASLCGLKITIGSDVWEYPLAEGGNSPGIHERRGGTYHAITNAGTNWSVTQDKYHFNVLYGDRHGVNLLTDSKQLSTGFLGNEVSRTEVGDMASGSKICRLAKTTTNNSASWQHTITTFTTNGTPLTFSFKVRATSLSSQMDAGLYHTVSGFSNSSISWEIISGPGTITQQLSGSLVRVTGLSQSEWTHVRVTASLVAGGVSRLYMYPDTYQSVTNGQTIDTAEWQLETGSSVTDYFQTRDGVSGLVRVPSYYPDTDLAANGLALTHPAGDWLNDCESVIDPDCNEPNATAWAGKTLPSTFGHSTATAGTSIVRRAPNSYRRDRIRVLA